MFQQELRAKQLLPVVKQGNSLSKKTLTFPTKVGFWSISMTLLELTLSKIRENIHKIAHPCAKAPLCEAQSFSKGKERNVRIQMRTRFYENIFLGKRIRKTSAIFLKFGWVWILARRRGLGRNARGLRLGVVGDIEKFLKNVIISSCF